jgi:hypothetical protein
MMLLYAALIAVSFHSISLNTEFPPTILRAFLDIQNNVHVTDNTGKEFLLTTDGNVSELRISPNGKTVAWRKDKKNSTQANTNSEDEIFIYRNRSIRSIMCEPTIRDYWFWMGGEKIALDCGGTHFAGRELLYDTSTLRLLEHFDQADLPMENRPNWSQSSNNFSGEE